MSEEKKEWLTAFIALYQSEECLWKCKSKDAKNRNKRDASYGKLLDKLKEIEPDATLKIVKDKINNIRTSHAREWNKVKQSKTSGCGADKVYVPRLWYYHLMEFLKDQDEPRRSRSNLGEASSRSNLDEAIDGSRSNLDEAENAEEVSCEILQFIIFFFFHKAIIKPFIFTLIFLSHNTPLSFFQFIQPQFTL